MYTEVRGRCKIETGLQSGYCGNVKFVAGHKKAFIIASSLLRLAEFREGRNRLLNVVCFLATVVETTISGSDLSAFDMSTQAAVITLKNRLPPNTFGAYITLRRQQPACKNELEWVPSPFPRRRSLWRRNAAARPLCARF